MPLLDIRDLEIALDGIPVVDRVSLTIDDGETHCLVGESGCGKTVTALSIARLLPTPPARYTGGSLRILDRDVFAMSSAGLHALRGGCVSYVFQEPGASLNPVMPIGKQVLETLARHHPGRATTAEVVHWLRRVGIAAPESRIHDYPHQLSGGMQQRAMIAMALASQPRLLVADEPTTALDGTVQAQVLDLLHQLQRELGMGILLITHHLGVVSQVADRLSVMHAGQIVESGPAREILARPRHPYTQALLQSVPEPGRTPRRLPAIPGNVPRPGAWPLGCRFHPRCPRAQAACRQSPPSLIPAMPAPSPIWVRCPLWNV